MSAEVLQQIEGLLPSLSAEEKKRLRARLEADLGAVTPAARRSLRGIFKDKVPSDVDVDAALKEVREEWLGEVEDIADGRPPR